jgi:hypothetical protein
MVADIGERHRRIAIAQGDAPRSRFFSGCPAAALHWPAWALINRPSSADQGEFLHCYFPWFSCYGRRTAITLISTSTLGPRQLRLQGGAGRCLAGRQPGGPHRIHRPQIPLDVLQVNRRVEHDGLCHCLLRPTTHQSWSALLGFARQCPGPAWAPARRGIPGLKRRGGAQTVIAVDSVNGHWVVPCCGYRAHGAQGPACQWKVALRDQFRQQPAAATGQGEAQGAMAQVEPQVAIPLAPRIGTPVGVAGRMPAHSMASP